MCYFQTWGPAENPLRRSSAYLPRLVYLPGSLQTQGRAPHHELPHEISPPYSVCLLGGLRRVVLSLMADDFYRCHANLNVQVALQTPPHARARPHPHGTQQELSSRFTRLVFISHSTSASEGIHLHLPMPHFPRLSTSEEIYNSSRKIQWGR